ncbi:MAG: GNAT family N-acetyltransferase [Candidatus Aminicenantes bacterium]|nr:MAG: GNAT family N-acetyltransferase [Candidatus Aminicenantes bacterium]
MFDYHPLTKERWSDFEELFGERGACGGCWCMWWRLRHSEFKKQKGEGNRKAMKAIVDKGDIPGVLAYMEGMPVAWCSVASRSQFSMLSRSRILKQIDEKPVWSIVCLFIKKSFRNQGLSIKLLSKAIEYVKQQGGQVVEGYPIEPKKDRMPDVFASTGLASAFRQAGFIECARRSATRPIMRYQIISRR